MKVIISTEAGLEERDYDFSTMPLSNLFHFASLGILEARYEMRKRRGFDPYKPLNEQSRQDANDYKKWLKENSDTIESDKEDSDGTKET
jgi:hypothetical protein